MATSTEDVKPTKRRKRSQVEEGPDAESLKSDQKPTAAEPEVLPEKKKRKEKKTIATNVDSEENPVVDSSKSVEIKPEFLSAAESKPEVVSEEVIETVPSKKKKQKTSTEGKKSEMEDGVIAETSELAQKPEHTAVDGGGVVPETKRRRKKKTVAAEDAITTNADSEGNPVVDASKSIETEQVQLVQKPEVSAPAEALPELGAEAEAMPEAGAKTAPGKKKKKQQKSPEGVKGTKGVEGSEMENGVNEEKKKKKKKKNKKKKEEEEEAGAKDPISIGDWQKYVKIKEEQLLGKPELVAVTEKVEEQRYVEICVICRKKGHSIPTCPELNDENPASSKDSKRKRKSDSSSASSKTLKRQRKRHRDAEKRPSDSSSASIMTLKRQRKRHRDAEKRRSQLPRPPQDAETKASQEDTSLVTGCAVQDNTMADETCTAREDESVVKADKEDESVAIAGKEDESVARAGTEDESVARAGKEDESVAIAGKEDESVPRAGREDESIARACKEDESVARAGKQDESVARAGKQDESVAISGKSVAKAGSASHSQKSRVKKSKKKQDPGVVISVA